MTASSEPQTQAAPASLHGRILAALEARILSGDWPPGHRIPSEHELTGTYDCSRMTVNKVLTQLVHAGLIERRRKAGSFVRRPLSQSAVLEIKDIKAEVLDQGLVYRYEMLSARKRRSRAEDRIRLGLAAAGPLLDVVCRHSAGRQPFCIEERLINLDAVPNAGTETFEAIAPGPWLIERVPWTAAEHRIRAEGAGAETAERLGLAVGAACLVIERRTSWAEQPVTFVRLTYPGDAHELVARFVPSQG
jgi:GntR family histidine utilization transcriptional repressor